MKHFLAIAAMSRNRVIGKGGQIPWQIPADMKFFRRMTTGQVVVMGRKTFESLPDGYRPLPNRENIVITRSGTRPVGVWCCGAIPSPENLIGPHFGDKQFWIIGGASIYAQTLPLCSALYLTTVKRDVDGDTFMPPIPASFRRAEVLHEDDEIEIARYDNQDIQ